MLLDKSNFMIVFVLFLFLFFPYMEVLTAFVGKKTFFSCHFILVFGRYIQMQMNTSSTVGWDEAQKQ